MKTHNYSINLIWTGNTGPGTSGYKSYKRDYTISIENKADLLGSSDPAFMGDKQRHNPEDLLVCSISSCHMLWFLHLASSEGIVVVEYTDKAEGVLIETQNGSGYFDSVTLNPVVKITDASKIDRVNELHHDANRFCFIANSLNFKVKHNPTCIVA